MPVVFLKKNFKFLKRAVVPDTSQVAQIDCDTCRGNVVEWGSSERPALDSLTSSVPDRVERFIEAAKGTAATVERIPGRSGSLSAHLSRICAGARAILVGESTSLIPEVASALRDIPGTSSNPEELHLASLDVGISEAFGGIAATGSICVRLDKRDNVIASLLAPLHVAILRSDCIVERPRDLFSRENFGGLGLAADFVFISGPSATADMGPLVRGVHGPRRLHIIVVE